MKQLTEAMLLLLLHCAALNRSAMLLLLLHHHPVDGTTILISQPRLTFLLIASKRFSIS
jgi:hypothetical protein